MLKLKICVVDYSELAYTPKSMYTQPLPVAQRNALYLTTALNIRHHDIVLMQNGCQTAEVHKGLRLLPVSFDKTFWQEEAFDAVIFLDTVEAGVDIVPLLPAKARSVLWSTKPVEHVSLLGLKSKDHCKLFHKVVTTNTVLEKQLQQEFPLTEDQCTYLSVAMTRTLRKRFPHRQAFLDTLPESLTLSFVQRPEHGLAETLDLLEVLKQGFAELKLQVLLPAVESAWTEAELNLLDTCGKHPDVTVFDPMPQPDYVEQLAKSHVLCSPQAFRDTTGELLIDAIASGTHCVAPLNAGLGTLGQETVYWIDPEPEEDMLRRYAKALADLLHRWVDKPDLMVRHSFGNMATFGTYFTWDLRVWDWESLLFQLCKTTH